MNDTTEAEAEAGVVDRIVTKAVRLADAYGQNWNGLSQDERRKYVDCVQAIESAATGDQQ